MAYTPNQLAQLWVKAGGPSKLAGLMAKIAGRESSGQPHATNTSSGAAGLWQINPAAWRNDPTLGPLFRSGAIYTPEGNAKAAAYVYQRQGLKAWATYNPATDAKYIGQAAQTASAGKSYGSSPSVAPATGDARTQIALSLLGMGNLGGYGGGDSLTQSLIAAAQQKAPAAASGSQGASTTSYGTQAKGVSSFEGKPVAAWIKPYLVKARQAGWQGTVSSGFRSLADQTRIYNSGVRPAAKPGTSNHEFTAFPGGAVDVTDAPQLAAILKRLRAPLQWAGSKDPVHFSVPHNGSY